MKLSLRWPASRSLAMCFVHVDLDGKPQSGVPVTFTVAAGGGSVTGDNVATGATGVATVGSWTLGTDPGTNALTATASISGSVESVRCTATGQAEAVLRNVII